MMNTIIHSDSLILLFLSGRFQLILAHTSFFPAHFVLLIVLRKYVKNINKIMLIPLLKGGDNTFYNAGRRDMCHANLQKQFFLSQVGRKLALLRGAVKHAPKEVIESEQTESDANGEVMV